VCIILITRYHAVQHTRFGQPQAINSNESSLMYSDILKEQTTQSRAIRLLVLG